jgi:hypothetical protein
VLTKADAFMSAIAGAPVLKSRPENAVLQIHDGASPGLQH